MRVGRLQQRGERAAELVGVGEGGAEIDEGAGQVALHQPAAHLAAAGRDVAEVDQQRVAGGQVLHVAAGDGEVDRQALRVLDDARLRRGDLQRARRRAR